MTRQSLPDGARDGRATHRVVTDRAEGPDLFPTLLGLAGLPPTTAVDFAPALRRGEAPVADPDRPFTFHTSRWAYRTPPP